MIEERKKRVIWFFIVIYALFGAALTYLLVFNTGLGIEQRDFGKEKDNFWIKVAVKNSSSHTINNIEVFTLEGEEEENIEVIASLSPGEEKEVTLLVPEGEESIQVGAKSSYHNTAYQVLQIAQLGGAQISYEIQRPPRTVTTQGPLLFELKLCNKGSRQTIIIIEALKYSDKEERGQKALELGKDECGTQVFSYEAKENGLYTVEYEIQAKNYVELITEEVEVKR